jgi:hypothetical protein
MQPVAVEQTHVVMHLCVGATLQPQAVHVVVVWCCAFVCMLLASASR